MSYQQLHTLAINTNKKPVGFELSIFMHMCYAFDNHIYYFSFMTIFVFLVWQTYFFFFWLFMPITFENVESCICIQNTNAHELSSEASNILHL